MQTNLKDISQEKNSGFDPRMFSSLALAEDTHFWFKSRNKLIKSILNQITADWNGKYRAIEIGCGNGNVLRVLESECKGDAEVIGLDKYGEGFEFARQRGVKCPLIQGDLYDLSSEDPFRLVGMFDTLEHIEHDRQVLTKIHTIMEPGGQLVITVPAHPSLWSYFDEAACHCRRYTVKDLRIKLEETGYEIQFISEFMMSIFPMVWMARRFNKLAGRGKSEKEMAESELKITPGVNGVLSLILSWEACWISGLRRLPIGTSIIAIARRSAT